MRTCIICGEEYTTGQGLHCHMRSHRHQHVMLTELQRQVILGSLLGDMSISMGYGKRNPRLDILHSTKQTEYVMWKYDVLENLVGTKPSVISELTDFGSGYSKINYKMRFNTRLLPCLLPIYSLVRGDGNKYISKSWLDEIVDPIGLAVWYMDDGSSTDKYHISFALGLISPKECSVLQDWMLQKWDINSHIYKIKCVMPKYLHSIHSVLSIGLKSNLRKFKELVEPYIISSMRYKIDKLDYLS